MTFYKNMLVCKRELIQLQESLLKMNPAMPTAAPQPSSKHLCYRCGFYFQARPLLQAHPCHNTEVKCPHCSFVLASKAVSIGRSRRDLAQAQPAQHWCRRCPYCKNMYDIRDQHHQRLCSSKFIVCPECQQRIPRATFRDHRNHCAFCRCYKCNAVVYKKMLAQHLIACCQIKKPDPRFNRKSVSSSKPFHYYHYRPVNESIAHVKRPVEGKSQCSPIPVCIQNWLRH